MKHRIAELEGGLLDAAVALVEGEAFGRRWEDWGARPYSDDWHFAGPIIERERIALYWRSSILTDGQAWPSEEGFVAGMEMSAELDGLSGDQSAVIYLRYRMIGLTPLIAAMRAYVASKFGDELELP